MGVPPMPSALEPMGMGETPMLRNRCDRTIRDVIHLLRWELQSNRKHLPTNCTGEDRPEPRRFVMNVELFRNLRATVAAHLRAKLRITDKLLDRTRE